MHKSVLLQEVIEGLNLKDGAVVLDGTFGAGGHSAEILKKFPKAKIIALDADSEAIKHGQERFSDKVVFHNINFRNMDEVLKDEKVDAVMLDIGLSSDQLENSGRGFSFMKDEPLLMTFKKSMKENPSPETLTAEDVVNDWSQDSLEKIIRGYGEEKYAGRIARGIVEARELGRLTTTRGLVSAIEDVVPGIYKRGRTHFATRTFQAIRIAVNDELGALAEGLEKGFEALQVGGRMAVISFHSLEDRIVKNFNKEKVKGGKAILINKKPIVAGKEELKENPRARSAKLRIIEKKQ